jgi:hypothetical protein
MPKRSWNQISSGATTQQARRPSTKNPAATRNDVHIIKSGSPSTPDETKLFQNGSFSEQQQQHPPTPTLTDAGSESRFAKSGARQRAASTAQSDDNEQLAWPSITRKVKACAACRKQKVGIVDFVENHIRMHANYISCGRLNVTWTMTALLANGARREAYHANSIKAYRRSSTKSPGKISIHINAQ